MPAFFSRGFSRRPRRFLPLFFATLVAANSAFAAEPKPGPPVVKPAVSLVTEAHYDATITDGVARIDCRFVVDAKSDDRPQPLPLSFGDAAVGSLKADDDDTYLKGLGKGRFLLMLAGKGRREVKLQLLAKASATKTGSKVTFACPPAGITTLAVTIAKAKQTISVSPTLVAGKVESADKLTTVKGNLTATSNITITYGDAIAASSAKPLIHVSDVSRVRVSDEAVITHARLRCSAYRAPVSTLKFAVAKDDRVLAVTLPDSQPGDWSETVVGERRIITVRLNKPIQKPIDVQIATSRKVADGTATIARIETVDANRQTGLLAVNHNAKVDVNIEDGDGWTAVSAADVAASVKSPGAAYYRYAGNAEPLSAKVAPAKPHLVVTQTAVANLKSPKATIVSTLEYHALQPGVATVDIALSNDAEVVSVVGKAVKSFGVDDSKSTRILRVHLSRMTTGPFELHVKFTVPLKTTERFSSVAIPLPRPQNVTESMYQLKYRSRKFEVRDKSLKSLNVTANRARSSQFHRFDSELEYFPLPTTPIRLEVRRKRNIESIASKTLLKFDPKKVTIETTLSIERLPKPGDPLRLVVPVAAAKSLTIPKADGTRVAFQVIPTKQWPKSVRKGTLIEMPSLAGDDSIELHLRYQVKIASAEDKKSPASFDYQPVVVMKNATQPLDASAESIAIQSDSLQRVQLADPTVAERTGHDRYDLKKDTTGVTFKITQLEAVPQPALLVAKALLEVSVGRDANAAYRCRYLIRPTDARQMYVELPKTAEPLAAYVNGEASSLRHDPSRKSREDWQSYVIDVEPGNKNCELAIQFRLPLSPTPFEKPLGKLRMHLPRLLDAAGTVAVVEQIRTALWVPKSYSLMGAPVGMTGLTTTQLSGLKPSDVGGDDSTNESEQWIGFAAPGEIELAHNGHVYVYDGVAQPEEFDVTYANMPFATWVLGLPLLIIGLLITRTHWQNKLSVGLLLATGVTLAAVSWGDAVYHGLLAARYGFVGVAAWWLVRSIRWPSARQLITHPAHEDTPACHLPMNGLSTVVIPPPGSFGGTGQPPSSNVSKAA